MNANNKKSIMINDKFYYISSTLVDETWNIILTNLDDLFIEKLPRAEIVQRCERLNPLLSIEDIDMDEIIRELFNDIPKYNVGALSLNEIKLQTVIDGGTFKFVIHLSRADDQEFREKVMKPVTSYVVELQKKFHDLIHEIEGKDEEISEYKANGAKLIRSHIETKPFDVKSWVSSTFKEYGDFISMCHSVSHNNDIELDKNIKIECNNDKIMLVEENEITICQSNQTAQSEREKIEKVYFSSDSVKYKKRKISDFNS